MNKQVKEVIDIARQSFHEHDEKDMKMLSLGPLNQTIEFKTRSIFL